MTIYEQRFYKRLLILITILTTMFIVYMFRDASLYIFSALFLQGFAGFVFGMAIMVKPKRRHAYRIDEFGRERGI